MGCVCQKMPAPEQAEGHFGALLQNGSEQGLDVFGLQVLEVGIQQQQAAGGRCSPSGENRLAFALVLFMPQDADARVQSRALVQNLHRIVNRTIVHNNDLVQDGGIA